MAFRQTIGREASLSGIGLHTGARSTITFAPSASGGRRFFRADIKGGPVRAILANVHSTVRGTNLAENGTEVFTVEHVLSACAALNIDDLDIVLDGPEPPIMDGSAKIFFDTLKSAGLRQNAAEARYLTTAREISYTDGNVFYSAKPADRLAVAFLFLHTHPLVARQEFLYDSGTVDYATQIAPARTFGFEEEVEALRKAGLARGGSLENCVVIAKDRFLNAEGGLRFKDEMVRHKILDTIGDLSLLDARLGRIRISAICGGHKHNVLFARQFAEAAAEEK